MAIVKVVEVLAQSPKGWEDAANEALAEASKSINNIQSIYIKEFQATVAENKITQYRVNAKISFTVDRDE